DECRLTKVCTARKERIKSLQVRIVWIVVAARDIRLQAKPWLERSVLKCETDIRSCRPRPDVSAAKTAELINELKVVVPTRLPSPNSRADGVPDFVSRALVEV